MSITNFLANGALLRHGNEWILFEGPFKHVSDADSGEFTLYLPDFYDLEGEYLFKAAAHYVLSSDELSQKLGDFLASAGDIQARPLMKAPWVEPPQSDFAAAFGSIQERIKKMEIQKAVPVVFARSPQTVMPSERAQMIHHLLQAPASLYVYGFWQKGEGILGATPEVLFSYSQKLIKTMALAGTCPKDETSQRSSLLHDEKEMQEHLIVVEDLECLFKKRGTVQMLGPMVVELPTLFHLKTEIEVQCQADPDFISLIKELHPTPALGVAPRTQGYKWMSAFPGQIGRRRFGAPFAVLGKREALCLVAIRNLQWSETESMIGSGCGILAASELEREWRELFQKRLSVRKILGLEK